MELGNCNISNGLKSLAQKHKFTVVENECTQKIVTYISKTKELDTPKKCETVFTEVLKMYLLELCFRRKFFGLLRYQKSVFIETNIKDLPEEINSKEDLIVLSDSLQEKDNPIRRKMIFSKMYLPHDVLKLLND